MDIKVTFYSVRKEITMQFQATRGMHQCASKLQFRNSSGKEHQGSVGYLLVGCKGGSL